MTSRLRIFEPDGAKRVTSDGRFWSEVAAALEAIATRCAERGYATHQLVLTGSDTDAKDTWRVELLTTEKHRARAETLKAQVVEVPAPERYIDTQQLADHVVLEFLKLTCGEETSAGLAQARRELVEVLSKARFCRDQDNGFELWRAAGRGAKYGKPRWRFLVSKHQLRRVLPEHDGAGRRRS